MLQQTRSKTSYDELLSSVIERIKQQGYDDIRADLSEYEAPFQLKGKTNDVNFTPDITATKNDGKAYFEISSKTDNANDLVNKWKLLETLAKMRGGIFKIFVPHGHMKFTQELIKDHSIHAELIKI